MKITILLSAGKIHNKTMWVEIFNNNMFVKKISEWSDKPTKVDIDTNLPCIIEFKVDGKHKFDTIIDENGKIVADKFIKVEAISIDGKWVNQWMLEGKLLTFIPNDRQEIVTNYFGSNGVGKFSIPFDDLLEFWLTTLIHD